MVTQSHPIMGMRIATRNSIATAAKALSAFSFTAWLLPFSISMTARYGNRYSDPGVLVNQTSPSP
jgi:hypothetical protein